LIYFVQLRIAKMQDQVRAFVDARAANWPNLTTSIAYRMAQRRADRPLDHARPVVGYPRHAERQATPRASRRKSSTSGLTPIEYIGAHGRMGGSQRWQLGTLVARADKGADDVTLCRVHGQGQRRLPHRLIPGHDPRLGASRGSSCDKLKAFNWLNWYGGKFSTSQKRGVFMDKALELLPGDYWRWYLMANAPESSDTAFTSKSFKACVNSRPQRRARQLRESP